MEKEEVDQNVSNTIVVKETTNATGVMEIEQKQKSVQSKNSIGQNGLFGWNGSQGAIQINRSTNMVTNAYRQQQRQKPQIKEVSAVFNDDQPLLPMAKKEKVKEATTYDLEANLQMEIKARQKIIKLSSSQTQLLPAMVNIKTKETTEEQEGDRSPIDLVCVIDISGSMRGEKIDLVRKTLISLLEIINEHDRLCLIKFDDKAQRLTPLLRNNKENLSIYTNQIGKLHPHGGTNIANGMNLAFKVLQERKESNPITSVFLLTDGLDCGADRSVSNCMHMHNLAATTFTIDCFGFGRDHDEDLLVNISKLKDGNFYFIDKLDTVDEYFASALGGLMSVVALDINLLVTNSSFKPFDGISIKRTFGDMWDKKGVTSGYQINLAQLLAGSEKGFMLEIQIPPMSLKVEDKERNICILDADFSAQDKSGKYIIKKNAKLMIHLINEDEEINEVEEDGEVLENYFRVKGAEAIEDAVLLANKGQYEEGSKKIDMVMEQINKNKRVDQKKMEPIMQQLVESKNGCQPQVYSAVGKKNMVSNKNCFIEQKAGRNNMCLNKAQARMVNQVQAKKAKSPIEQ